MPKTHIVNLRMDDDMWNALSRLSELEGRYMTEIIRRILDKDLKRDYDERTDDRSEKKAIGNDGKSLPK